MLLNKSQVAIEFGYKNATSFSTALTRYPDRFPKPNIYFGASPRWDKAKLEKWIEEHSING